jgi:hypothetical protein
MLKVHLIRALVLIVAVAALLGVPGKSGAAPTALGVAFYCQSMGWGRMESVAQASGGTPPYTYAWNPGPYFTTDGDSIADMNCSPYRWLTVTVTVTDSAGASASCSHSCYCGEAP